MIGNRTRIAGLAAAAVALGLTTGAMAADFDAGWAAYQKGEFAAALKEWQPLADSGDKRAQFNLGLMYDEGRGVSQDRKQALAWWEKSANQGYAQAQHNLALAYIF